jgi:Icc-related predicted phosphoesterase
MKILFVTDLHGVRWKYERLPVVAKSSEVDMVINGGDMLPREGHDSTFQLQKDFITDFLRVHFGHFEARQTHYLCYLANDDPRVLDPLFDEVCHDFSFVIPLAQRKCEIRGYEFIGMNWVADYPFRLKDRCRKDTKEFVLPPQYGKGLLSTPQGLEEIEDWPSYANALPTIGAELDRLPCPQNMSKTVYVIHNPPSRLGLDVCGDGREVGSKAVYDFLTRNQPLLSLHGHIHESPEVSGKWNARLGETICIQPGQLDAFTYVLIDLATMKFERFREERGG